MIHTLVGSVLVATLGFGAAQGEVIERIVAKVNGQIITKTQLDKQVQGYLEQAGPAATPEEEQRRRQGLQKQILERMIDNLLVLQVATDKGLQVPPRYWQEWKANVMKESGIESEEEFVRQVELQGLEMAEFRTQWEESLLVQEIRRMEVDNKISVNEPEIEKYYHEHAADYTEPAKVRLREIVVRFEGGTRAQAAEKAERLLQDIRQGADFADVARLNSDSASRDAGGDLGFFEEGELTEPLNEVAFQLTPGEVSDVLEVGSAYYIVRIEERTEDKTLPLDDVRRSIADSIFQKKLQEKSEQYLTRLREEAIIEIRL
jgi:parvulin-like peptidyl-prolyl isomerase